MSGVNLLDMYGRASGEVFRLEAQRLYAVPAESAQLLAFTEGRPLPSDPRVDRSMQVIRAAVGLGRRIYRVHVINLPLTLYLRYEMVAYLENIAAGEGVNIAVRTWNPVLESLTEDFVLFDPGTDHQAMVWMRYDDQGQLTGLDYSTDPADLAVAIRQRDLALANAVTLSEFVGLADAG